MGPGSFDDFVQREVETARKSRHESIDWEAEKKQWLRHLDDLYSRLIVFLRQYIDAEQISTRTGSIELNEEHIGTYTAPTMTIVIGSKAVTIEPLGTVMAGSRGRIDITCNLARSQMILVESGTVAQFIPSSGIGRTVLTDKKLTEGRWVWKIVTHDTVDLTRDTFLAMLLEVANG